MKIRFTAQEKGQRVILEEFEGQVLFQTDRVVTVYVPKSIAEKLGRERMNEDKIILEEIPDITEEDIKDFMKGLSGDEN